MKPLRVLSIDWDYFIKATAGERMEMFPDGGNENIPDFLGNIIWSSRYAQNTKLGDIAVDFEALDILKSYANRFVPKETPCLVVDSHKHIYEFIKFYKLETTPLEIVNIDFHHDYYGDNPFNQVDCGNWVNNVFENETNKLIDSCDESNYYWVKRDDSDEIDVQDKKWFHVISIKELDRFVQDKFDLLFICRSSVWSPPHLDMEFIELCNWFQSKDLFLCSWETESNCLNSRYTEEFLATVCNERKILERLKEKYQQEER